MVRHEAQQHAAAAGRPVLDPAERARGELAVQVARDLPLLLTFANQSLERARQETAARSLARVRIGGYTWRAAQRG